VKSSELLFEFAEPLLFDDDTLEMRRSSLEFAVVAWNLALLPEDGREQLMADLPSLEGASPEDEMILEETLRSMVERKLTHFGQYHRHFSGVCVTMMGRNKLHVQVASAMSEEEHRGELDAERAEFQHSF
jgi:hypothetical protein